MFVKYIVLDGFKSYRDYTKIGPFDPHFNAITGLNGSGKSNVLDAICFVLGITSMSTVRCKNLADCIYMGQGENLNRASVSIVLDNTDKNKSPPGQQNYDEIIVSRTVQKGGDCRYHINRIGASKRAVTDLFESVQLNVNNPNFMIMQGKITKVVNMKPKELLHMIEETVGATLYQAKREKAELELKNKQQTIESINGLIFEHIKPSLDKQTKAFDTIQEYNIQMREKNDRAIEWAIANYFELQNSGKKAKEELNKILEQDEKDDQVAEEYKEKIKRLKHREEQMKKENTSRFQEKVDAAEKALKEQKKQLQVKETDVKTAKEAVDKAKKAVKDAEKAKATEEKHVQDFRKKSEKSVNEFEVLQKNKQKAKEDLEKAEEQENQLRSGKLLDDEGKSMDVNQEINRLSTEIAAIKPEVEDGRQRIQENKRKLTGLEQQLKTTPSDDQVERDFKQKEQIVEKLKREAVQRNIDPNLDSVGIGNTLSDYRRQYDAASRERESIMRRNHFLSLYYNKQRVNSRGILGCVYDHIKMDGAGEWANALETAIGGFVSHIVVESDDVGKDLLKNGQLSRRTYVHPLNKFQSRRINPISQAMLDQKFGPGNAVPAIDLVEYEGWMQPLVNHYLGGRVLCKTMDIARECAFKLGLLAYTVAGDFVDPGGIMKGGSRNDLGITYRDCVNLFNTNKVMQELGKKIEVLNQQKQLAETNEQFMQQFEKAKRDLQNADQIRKMTKYSQLKAEIESIKQMLHDDAAKLKEIEANYTSLEKTKAQLQKKADGMESHRAKQMTDIKNRIAKSKSELEAITKKFDAREKYFKELEVEINSKEAFLNECQKDIDDANAHVEECKQKLEAAQKELETFMEKFQQYQSAYDEAVAESNEWHEEAKQIQDQIKALDKQKELSELNKMKRNNQRSNYQQYVDGAAQELQKLQERFPSIDFTTQQPPRGGKKAAALKQELDKITKKLEDMQQRLDHEAAAALPQTKREFSTSTDKLNMIEKNKKCLVKAIETLDLSKKQKVRMAYDEVNFKFNNMMSTLLPEARARLVEVSPGDLSQGVNIHVQLGGVWKESLTELSGGQRSLVALSLVLSLCMFNPAPFYILDEVDAALDLSHTQNIGVVIQRQFKETQFICVSLKDGMFSNANVLFTAKHEGGRSVVTRSAKPNRAMPPPNTEDKDKRNKTKK